ncbi:PREDICTED: suppressor protein SRP40-like [Rhagoletis zephyria]|uniref:suppressor protein SRP40-like n=1 Tax=Rhagoletis zephyria TaxID=28612 RepID=UPI0008115DDF|nr:PREDICTED: suppressor protein SRP40-like [Rhagoletis zephyria]
MPNCNSSKSSSSTSSSSLSRSSSFSEDCDDSMAAVTYCPKSPQQESDSEDSNDETFNPSANSTTVFRPLLENFPRDTASTVVQQSVDSTSISYAAPSLSNSQPGTSTSKMVSSSIIPNSPLKKGKKEQNSQKNGREKS